MLATAAAVPAHAPLALKVVTNWAWNPWLLTLCVLAAGVMVVYLYRAQQKIASPRVIRALTVIRVLLVLLVLVLLSGFTLQQKKTGTSGGSLWLVVDQSGSMAHEDKQSTPLERLRWADTLGYFPGDLRPSKLDRQIAKLQSLRADLAYLRTQGELATEAAEAEKRKDEFVEALGKWNQQLVDLAGVIEKDAAMKGNSGDTVRGLRASSDKLKAAVDKADDRAARQEAAADVPWVELLGQLDNALAALRPIADAADNKFLTEKANDRAVADALAKAGKLTRAQLAFLTLTEKSKLGGTGISELVERQDTKVVSFADQPHLTAVKDAGELSKALKDAAATGKSTNVSAALQYINTQLGQDEPASVVVWSDGRQNVGGDLVEPTRALAARGVRVFTLALGSEKVAPDAAIEQIDAPDWIYKDDTLKGSVLLRLDGLTGRPVKVEFRRGEQLLESETQTFTPTSDRDTKLLSFRDKPPEPGVFDYGVRVIPIEDEAIKENNAQLLRVAVKKDKLNVLIIEDQPRWEYRYLANYLVRDQRVKLQTVLLQPASIAEVQRGEPRKASPKNDRTEAELLPEKTEEWAAFDMIVIGDVPKERFPEAAQKAVVASVKDRGATLLLIAGLFNMPQRFGGTALAEVLPVDLSAGGGDWAPDVMSRHLKQGFKATVAPEGLGSVLSQFTVDEQANAAIFNNLPAWYWHSEYTNVRAANVIWSIEDYKKPEAGKPATTAPAADSADNTLDKIRKRALLSTGSVGMGRVMYLASDSTWRLRQVNGMNLHERFWGQVIRWVVGNDLPAGGRFVRFGANRPRYVAGDQVIVTSRLLGEDYAPLKGEKVKVVAKLLPSKDPATGKPTGGEGKVVGEATLMESIEAPGYYRAALAGLPAGAIELSLQGDKVEKLLASDESVTSKSLHVDIASQLDVEQRNINPDRPALATIARAGGGVALDAPYSDVLAAHVPALNYSTERVEQWGLFNDPNDPNTKKAHWLFLGLFTVLVSAEWIIRKATGLV